MIFLHKQNDQNEMTSKISSRLGTNQCLYYGNPRIVLPMISFANIHMLSIIALSVFCSSYIAAAQPYIAAQKEDSPFKIEVTFIEGRNRNVSDARVYIQEYPQYGTNPPDGSYIDLNDAFYNDDPYTGIWKNEVTIPPGTIQVGEEFHACLEDINKGITLACYELENTEEQGPEKLTIDFNNFP